MTDVNITRAMLDEPADITALDVLRRGIGRTPSVKRTMIFSGVLSVLVATGRLAVPVLVQQVLDRGLLGEDGYRPRFVLLLSGIAMTLIVVVAVLAPLAEIAMVRGAQDALYELRCQAFAKVHRLSFAEQSREKKGVLLTRVTSDVETVSEFVEWGVITWATNGFLIIGAFGVMMIYSWQLALVALATMLTTIPAVKWLQVRQLRAYDRVRTAVGTLMSTFNELLTGSDAIRSYGYQRVARRRVEDAVSDRYQADLGTAKYTAMLFTVGDFIGAVTLVVVALTALEWGSGWGLDTGSIILFFFLVALIQVPVAEISDVLDQTQAAVAGWNKVLTLLEREPGLEEAHEPQDLPSGALSVVTRGLSAGYQKIPVLHDVNVSIPAGARVAVVGETGSGKTTFARLLCRLMDPTSGVVSLGGTDLRKVSDDSRHRSVRLVPQDGFLFHASVADNIRYGRDGATDDDVVAAIAELGLGEWVAGLPDGLATDVGPRGEQLSVGERQLVALARAQVGDPGLLILDEATSSVDPETEQALADALSRVARGRTMISIAHRLSTAEDAELVIVFDGGVLVEQGTHAELVALGGVYARLHRSWVRSTT